MVSSNFNRVFLLFLFFNLFPLCSKSQPVVIRFPWFKYQNKKKLPANNSDKPKVMFFFSKKFSTHFYWKLLKKNLKFWISKFFRKLKSKFKNVRCQNCWLVFSECIELVMTKIEKEVFEILKFFEMCSKLFFVLKLPKYQKFRKNAKRKIFLELRFTYNIKVSAKSVCK